MDKIKRQSILQLLRFLIVGFTAVIIQYAVYLLALNWFNHNVSFLIGYSVSFLFNYIFTIIFTFKTKINKKRTAGFTFSHIINFCLQNGLLNLFIYSGINKQWAMIPVLLICVPSNFLVIRYFMKEITTGSQQ